MKTRLICAAAGAMFAASPAAATDVATFMTKAAVVKQKGVLAPLSSEYKSLMEELETSTKALKAERLARLARGERPAYCPTGKNPLLPQDIFAGMEAVPVARRPHTQVKDVLRELYVKRYPCPA